MNWDQVQQYVLNISSHNDPVLLEMEKEAEITGFPIVGKAAGKVCYLLTRLVKAKSVFEMGSGYGYSTAWFAMAVRDNGGGIVHHTVWDETLSRRAREYLSRMGLDRYVSFTVGEAIATLRRMKGPFDCIFIDIDKDGYPEAVEVAKDKLTPGGIIIIDNVLWHGRVLDGAQRDPTTEAIKGATQMLVQDPLYITTLLPIRDGLLVAAKIG
ncbi:MAG: O-methyltransferase [Armatimonadetes bacterium]|nr:O-methyltransferase [Armatimonadota bacterium]MDW8120952.1 O-methyltransferase [Armatimonadota bacterium]